jgi:hypothetical protein
VKTSSRWLTGFGVGLAMLIILALGLVYALGQRNELSFPANTPEGTVQRYLLAIQANDIEKAKTYVKKDSDYYSDFKIILSRDPGFTVTLINAEVTGNKATVDVYYKPVSYPLYINSYEFAYPSEFYLQKDGDLWFITGDGLTLRH